MSGLQNGASLGSFELGEVLSEVAYGTVYEARRSSDGLRAAVTVIADQYAEDGDEFLAAADAVQGLVHAHLVTIHESGRTESGAPWIATDLLSGSPLSVEIDEQGKLTEPRAAAITKQMLSAIEALHGRDVIHEGLTPNSIVLTETAGDEDHVRLLCFGTLAKLRRGVAAESEKAAELAPSLGEVRYAAPEQLAGDATVSARADIYATGLILLEMLTGHPANAEESLDAAFERQVNGKLKLDPALTKRPITKAMALALVKDPTKRFRSATQFRQALDRIPGLKVSKKPLSISGPGSYGGSAKPPKPSSSLADLRSRLQLAKKKNDAGGKAGERAAKALAEAEEEETDAPTMLVALDALKGDAKDADETMQVGSDALARVKAAAEAQAAESDSGDAPVAPDDRQSKPTVRVSAVSGDAPAVELDGEEMPSGPDEPAVAVAGVVGAEGALETEPMAADADGFSEMSLADAAARLSSPEGVPNVAELAAEATQTDESDVPDVAKLAAQAEGDTDEAAGAVAGDVEIPATMATMAGEALIPAPRPEPDPRTDDALVVTERESSPLLMAALVLLAIGVVVLLFVVFSGGDDETPPEGDGTEVAAQGTSDDGEAEDGDESGLPDEDGADDSLPVDEVAADESLEGDLPVPDLEAELGAVDDEMMDDGLEMDFADDATLGEDLVAEPVLVALSTTPEGARVVATDGEEAAVLCEATPCEVTLADGATSLEVAIELDGHEPQTTILAADGEPVALTLEPAAAEAAVAAAATEAAAEPEKKPERRKKKRRKKKKKKKKKDDNPFGARTFD